MYISRDDYLISDSYLVCSFLRKTISLISRMSYTHVVVCSLKKESYKWYSYNAIELQYCNSWKKNLFCFKTLMERRNALCSKERECRSSSWDEYPLHGLIHLGFNVGLHCSKKIQLSVFIKLLSLSLKLSFLMCKLESILLFSGFFRTIYHCEAG